MKDDYEGNAAQENGDAPDEQAAGDQFHCSSKIEFMQTTNIVTPAPRPKPTAVVDSICSRDDFVNTAQARAEPANIPVTTTIVSAKLDTTSVRTANGTTMGSAGAMPRP
jgi:hypothetical protein